MDIYSLPANIEKGLMMRMLHGWHRCSITGNPHWHCNVIPLIIWDEQF
jgi:hypothetical protein